MYAISLKSVEDASVLEALRGKAAEWQEVYKGLEPEDVHSMGNGYFQLPYLLYNLCGEEMGLVATTLP